MGKAESEIKETHLEFIQNTITRMGQNSFQAKEWCITLNSALLAFKLTSEKTNSGDAALGIAIAVTVLFCILDTYYLYLERGFRELYNMAARITKRDKDYKDYCMAIPKKCKGILMFFATLCRPTTGLFYSGILIGLTVLLYLK